METTRTEANPPSSASPPVLVQEWFRRSRQNQRLHYRCADYFSKRNRWLGIPAIVISTLVGSAVFASVEHEASGTLKIALGMLSIVAAVLASLQTFLSYSERAERHRITSARYASVGRQLELLAATDELSSSDSKARLSSVLQALDSCAEAAPHVPQSIEAAIKKELDGPRSIAGKQSS